MYCEHCGKKLKDDATRCSWCGTPVNLVISHEAEQDDVSQNAAAANPSEPDMQDSLHAAQTEEEKPNKKKRRWRR